MLVSEEEKEHKRRTQPTWLIRWREAAAKASEKARVSFPDSSKERKTRVTPWTELLDTTKGREPAQEVQELAKL